MVEPVVDEVRLLDVDASYPLSERQISGFHKNGWVLLPGLLSRSTCAVLRGELAKQAHSDSIFMNPEQNAILKRESLGWKASIFQELGTSQRVGGTAARLMRLPEVLFVQDMTFSKPSGGAATHFHQDYPFSPYDRSGAINLWIALVDVSADMGPLAYLEKSHRLGTLGRFGAEDMRDHYPALRDLSVGGGTALGAGDALVHLDLTIHGAAANTSGRVREAYAARYARPDTIYTGTRNTHFDRFQLEVDAPLASSRKFALVGPAGLLAGDPPSA